jgi:hypothetical protein
MASVSTATGIQSLPPELFTVIVNQLPLPLRPPALRSLAISSRQISQIVIPFLLYEHVILHDERRLISAVDSLCRNPQARAAVRGLYIRTFFVLGQDGKYPAMTRLKHLFERGGLSRVHTVDWSLGPTEGQWEKPSHPFESLDETFWINLSNCCPNLRNIRFDHLSRMRLTNPTSHRNLLPWGRHSHLSHLKVRLPWPFRILRF